MDSETSELSRALAHLRGADPVLARVIDQHAGFDPRRVGQVLRESSLRTRRLSFAIGLDRPTISALRAIRHSPPR